MDRVDKAFAETARTNFLPDYNKRLADFDEALPIGFGQTNSQPTTVRMMLEWLDPQPGDKVLDVGSGSGWTSALLANLVGPKGKVYAVEIIPELLRFGEDNCRNLDIRNVRFFQASKAYGLPKSAPYDRILVSASALQLPKELLGQLKAGGKMVIPIHNTIYEIDKINQKEYEQTQHSGFVFVPLVAD